MSVLRFFFGLMATSSAAFVGNWLGGQIRFMLTGKSTQTIYFVHTTPSGNKINNFPIATKFYPALVIALLGKPRWLFALLGGTLTGFLVDDKYEAIFLERVIIPIFLEHDGPEP